MDVRSRTWSYTINNYDDKTLNDVENFMSFCKYAIYGKETASTGTPHLQCYSYSHNAISFSKMKAMFPTAHLEKSKGSAEENFIYCSKDKEYKEFGIRPKQGKRTDLDEIKDVVMTTGKMSEVVLVARSYQSVKMAEQILKYHEPKRDWKPCVRWFYGATGTGKSKLAYELFNNDCYTTLSTGRWFDGYDAHENVLIDDMRKDFMKFHELLRLLDRYPMRVETKGGTRQFLAKHIIITSAFSPQELYETREDVQQLIRRIDEIKEF